MLAWEDGQGGRIRVVRNGWAHRELGHSLLFFLFGRLCYKCVISNKKRDS